MCYSPNQNERNGPNQRASSEERCSGPTIGTISWNKFGCHQPTLRDRNYPQVPFNSRVERIVNGLLTNA
jgi:hypothetical protein